MRQRARTAFHMLVAVAALTAVPGADAATDDRWRITLGQQLKAEKSCILKEVLSVNEMPLGNDIAMDGRVSCIDGREYNFSRKRPHQKFTIDLCEPLVC